MPCWRNYKIPSDVEIHGYVAMGDKTVRPTTRLNRNFMLWFGWKTVIVFEAGIWENSSRGYRIGFRSPQGPSDSARVTTKLYYDRRFRMLIGREWCEFFIIDSEGRDSGLVFIDRTTKDDPTYANIPLR
jgi:hypothetical protein